MTSRTTGLAKWGGVRVSTATRLLRQGWRQSLVLGVMVLCALGITRNLVYWQITQHTDLSTAAAAVYDAVDQIPAPRGEILDANHIALVTSRTVYTLAVDPTAFAPGVAPSVAARKIATVLHLQATPLARALTTATSHYVPIAQGLDDAAAAELRRLHLGPGLILTPTTRTAYPDGALAAPLLGFVNAQGIGQYGLEQEYDHLLRGRNGVTLKMDNTTTRPLPPGVPKDRPAIPGATLVLTLDENIQQIVEKRLQRAISATHARGGSAVVLNPKTGAILAMASLPSYDPNDYSAYAPRLYKNRAIENVIPGSIFKVISVATGFDTGAFTPHTTVFDPGFLDRYGMVVTNWRKGFGWGTETPEIMLRHSANVGMAQFADMIRPTQRFYGYLINRWGFDRPTGIGLPGEESGLLRTPRDGDWQPEDVLVNAYGQSIDVTPLQMVAAVGALANGGKRMRPYIVQEIVAPGGRIQRTRPQVAAQAVSPATARTMTHVLHRAGLSDSLNDNDPYGNAETTCALTAGFPIAAKTGTATLDTGGGTEASLIGYAPINHPRFVMLVTIDRPQPGPSGQDIYGSMAAGPAWHDIAEHLYRYMHIQPSPDPVPIHENIPLYQGPNGWGCPFEP